MEAKAKDLGGVAEQRQPVPDLQSLHSPAND
jgi:hypothetical protein